MKLPVSMSAILIQVDQLAYIYVYFACNNDTLNANLLLSTIFLFIKVITAMFMVHSAIAERLLKA